MLLSKSCEYGVRAALYLALKGDHENVPIREISDKLNISFHFLTKILQTLTHEGLIASHKGPKGGVALGRPADDITLIELVVAIDSNKVFTQCVLGLPGCGEKKPCPLHEKWAYTREALQVMFQNTTLAEMARKMKENNLRLADTNSFTTLMKA